MSTFVCNRLCQAGFASRAQALLEALCHGQLNPPKPFKLRKKLRQVAAAEGLAPAEWPGALTEVFLGAKPAKTGISCGCRQLAQVECSSLASSTSIL